MEWLVTIVLLVIVVGEIVVVLIKIPQTKIALGNLGDLWVRVPENTVIAVIKNRKLVRLIFAVSETKGEIVKFKNTYKKKGVICDVTKSESGGLYYIGPSFLGYDVYEWFETPEDEKDGIHVLHSIDLAEQVIEYLPAEPKMILSGEDIIPVEKSEHDQLYGVPSFKSADNIEIRTKLTIYFKVEDPKKALFDVRYRKKAIKDQIFPLWRDVLGEFSFFVYQASQISIDPEKLEEQIEKGEAPQVVPDIRSESNNALRKRIGMKFAKPEKETGEKGEEAEEAEEKESHITSELTKNGLAQKLFLDKWGIRVTDVTVGDLDASDPRIEEALGAQMIARTKALADIEKAIGEKLAFQQRGTGEKDYLSYLLQGLAGENKALSVEALHALVQLKNFEALKAIPPEGRVFYQWPSSAKQGSSSSELLTQIANFLGTDIEALKNILGGQK